MFVCRFYLVFAIFKIVNQIISKQKKNSRDQLKEAKVTPVRLTRVGNFAVFSGNIKPNNMAYRNITDEYSKLRSVQELNLAVVNNTAIIERNYYTLMESTLNLVLSYDEKKEFKLDDEQYSNLLNKVDANSRLLIPWEGSDKNKQGGLLASFIKDLNIFQKEHHCRLCGSTIYEFKEYDLYYLSLLIEQEYLKNLTNYDQLRVKILKYWFIKFKVCFSCDYNLILKKDRKMYEDMILKKGGYDEQSGQNLDWILSKIDYYNNLNNVISFLLKNAKKADLKSIDKLTDYLKILEDDILYKLKIKIILLKKENSQSELDTLCLKLADNLMKKVNMYLINEVKPNMPKQEVIENEKPQKEDTSKADDKKDEIRNRIIIYEEQKILLKEQYETFKMKRQFKDCKEIKRNIEMLDDEITVLEAELR